MKNIILLCTLAAALAAGGFTATKTLAADNALPRRRRERNFRPRRVRESRQCQGGFALKNFLKMFLWRSRPGCGFPQRLAARTHRGAGFARRDAARTRRRGRPHYDFAAPGQEQCRDAPREKLDVKTALRGQCVYALLAMGWKVNGQPPTSGAAINKPFLERRVCF
jgi:hypothetical protein